MGISNNFIKTNIVGTSTSNAINLSGLTGLNTSYRFFKEGFYKLNPREPLFVVPKTINKVSREITIFYKDDLNPDNNTDIKLYWGNKNQHPKTIQIGGAYKDISDGGIGIVAESSQTAIIEVIVRQDSEILYDVGNYFGDDEMPTELIIRPLIQTGTLYSMPASPAPISIGENNLKTLFDSNNGAVTGTKIWAVDQFQSGKEYNFKINFSTDVIGNGRQIIINLTPIEIIMKAVLALESSGANEIDEDIIPKDLIGWVKEKSYYQEVNAVSGINFKLKPTHTRYILSFDAENPETIGYTDTIIGTYQKNTIDPFEGGTFTFLGF